MPSLTSQTESVADAETSNSGFHIGHGRKRGVGDDTSSPTEAAQMSSSYALISQGESHGDRRDSSEPGTTGSVKAQQAEDIAHQDTADSGDNGKATSSVETSVWNWNAPLPKDNNTRSASSYYFEPQGELLLQNDQRRAPGEVDIPAAISDWQHSEVNNRDGFLVPPRPSGNDSAVTGSKRKSASEQSLLPVKRLSRTMSESGEDVESPTEPRPSAAAQSTRSQNPSTSRLRNSLEEHQTVPRTQAAEMRPSRPSLDVGGGAGPQRGLPDPGVTMVLPARKVFPIQIGDKLFRLSGASISSDAPSYFSQFFEEQLRNNEGADGVRTLYIDRDPATFEDISLHLQGYHIEPKDGPHFVKLFADAQFFSLPRLTAQLFSSTIYIRIGDSEFQIPRDLFSNPGDSPNYFSLGFSIFFTTPNDAFPGLSQRSLIRPPSLLPPSVPNRSARTFADLMHILKGYPVEIRSEEHRQELLRDARYYHLKGLEQRLIPHQISYNLARTKSEILVRLEDIRTSGVTFVPDSANDRNSDSASPASSAGSSGPTGPGWVYYQRPYADSEANALTVEIGGEENAFVTIEPGSTPASARIGRATFHRQTLTRITRLFSVIADKMNIPVTQPLGLLMLERGAGASLPVSPHHTGVSEERVKIRIGPDADVVLDGQAWVAGRESEDGDGSVLDVDVHEAYPRTRSKKRKAPVEQEAAEGEEWIISKAQWRLRVQPLSGGVQAGKSGMEVILGAVKIVAISNERSRNVGQTFLT